MSDNAHDRFFKEVFTNKENAIDLIQGTLSKDLLQHLDFSTIELDNQSYVTKELKEFFSDIVYKIRYKNKTYVNVSLLLEHKSYFIDNPYVQLILYKGGIWQTNIKQKEDLQVVIAMIVYHGKQKWEVKKFSDYFPGVDDELKQFIPEFKYLLQDLSHLSDEDIKNRVFSRAATEIAALMMKHIHDFSDPKKVKEQEPILLDLLGKIIDIGHLYYKEEEGLRFFQAVINYLFRRSELPREEVIKKVTSISIEGGKEAMTIEAQLINKGIEQGIEQEKQIVLIRLINRKFGLTEQEEALIRNYSNLDALDHALEEVLFAETKEEVLNCLI